MPRVACGGSAGLEVQSRLSVEVRLVPRYSMSGGVFHALRLSISLPFRWH